jgi:hypothetical protein
MNFCIHIMLKEKAIKEILISFKRGYINNPLFFTPKSPIGGLIEKLS